ncbi:MAG: hypothetical protein JGK29_10535 [Microcoleus sp. PH2017_17_BER_D_A]|nr:hypothetical protein [Microcoleus sp. PH2017_17_BER_D_A]
MLDKIANLLPTATLFAIHGAAFSELRNRGEIIENDRSQAAEPEPDGSFYYLGVRIKIVTQSKWELKGMRIELFVRQRNGLIGIYLVNGSTGQTQLK